MNRRNFLTLSSLSLVMLYGEDMPNKAWNLGKYGYFEFKNIHKNLYIMQGLNVRPNEKNKGFINNPAFIESKNGLIVIDPGGSNIIGKEVLKQIERVSSKPIIAIFLTHNHADHWFATGVLKKRYPKAKIYGHKDLESFAKIRYFENIGNSKKNLTLALPIFYPTHFLKDAEELEIDGEKLFIQHPPFAHTNTDICISHINSNTLFTGDLVLRDILANFGYKSSIVGNIRFLEKLMKQKKHALYVPGHGAIGKREETLEPYLNFLKIIEDEVKQAYEEDIDFFDLKKSIPKIIENLEWQGIDGFDHTFIPQYLEHIYLEMGMEFLNKI